MGIKLKRSAVAGKAPVVGDLELGELAVNTYDGKLFTKKNVSGTESIVEIGPVASVAGKTGAVTLAKGDVGLGNVDNTSDANKPISSATQTALDGKAASSHSHAISDVTGLQTALDGKLVLSDVVGKQTISIPAEGMVARTTNGAAYVAEEQATNDIMANYWAFDAVTSEAVQARVRMPKGWNRNAVEVEFQWKHPSTTVNFGVKWGVRARAVSDGDAIDGAWGTEQEVADTGGTTGTLYKSAFTSALTIGNTPAEGDVVFFEFYRDPADASDTMAVDAHLLGVTITYTTNAAKDD